MDEESGGATEEHLHRSHDAQLNWGSAIAIYNVFIFFIVNFNVDFCGLDSADPTFNRRKVEKKVFERLKRKAQRLNGTT